MQTFFDERLPVGPKLQVRCCWVRPPGFPNLNHLLLSEAARLERGLKLFQFLLRQVSLCNLKLPGGFQLRA